MVKISYIRKKKNRDKTSIYRIIFIVLISYILIKSVKLFSQTDMYKYFTRNNTSISLYKLAVNNTLPFMNSMVEDMDQPILNMETLLLEKLTGLNVNKICSIIDTTLPIVKYTNNKYETEVASINELGSDYFLNNNNTKIQNDEDYFQGIKQDEIFKICTDESIHEQIENYQYTMKQLQNVDFLKQNFYAYDSNLMSVSIEDFQIEKYFNKNLTMNTYSRQPKLLIFHTHSQEAFINSRPGKVEDTVVGVGDELARILNKEYGISVLHHKGKYDVVNGKLNRDGSYERMEPEIRKILAKYPSIEFVIDLHRDGVPSTVHLATNIDGKSTAKIMFVNGLCKKKVNGVMKPVSYLKNPYITDNMALSLRLQLLANKYYPKFTRKIYLKEYRYSLHMKPKSLLLEVGAQTNTVEEAKNAMKPLADILYRIVTGKE